LDWAAPPGISPIPQTTALSAEAGARARIAAVAAGLGVEPVEDERPGPIWTIWVGEMVAMVRSIDLRP